VPATLADRLRERIRREGPISFADFMEAALYDPEEGYYSRGARIGEPGDFVTSPSLSPHFAASIARVFAADAASLGGEVTFVDVGAGEGRFLADFRTALESDSPHVARRTGLVAVERSAEGRQRLETRGLPAFEELPDEPVRGWIFGNELYDAFPVVRLHGTETGVDELKVGVEEDRFAWTATPASDEWTDRLSARGIALAPGQVAEVRRGAADFHRRLARALERGRIVLFDYGHRTRTLYHPLARRGGTLAVHSRGLRGGDPLASPGAQDLTAHVDWDELLSIGVEEGLTNEGPIRQARFLTRAGIFDFATGDAEKWRVYRLVDPTGMGEEISALVQSRDMEPLAF
jgi:SAM-dependent MidA family methyltransferase